PRRHPEQVTSHAQPAFHPEALVAHEALVVRDARLGECPPVTAYAVRGGRDVPAAAQHRNATVPELYQVSNELEGPCFRVGANLVDARGLHAPVEHHDRDAMRTEHSERGARAAGWDQ